MANLVESENVWPNIECEALKDKTEWRQRDKAKANNQDLSTYIASSMFLSEYKLFVNIFQKLPKFFLFLCSISCLSSSVFRKQGHNSFTRIPDHKKHFLGTLLKMCCLSLHTDCNCLFRHQ